MKHLINLSQSNDSGQNHRLELMKIKQECKTVLINTHKGPKTFILDLQIPEHLGSFYNIAAKIEIQPNDQDLTVTTQSQDHQQKY